MKEGGGGEVLISRKVSAISAVRIVLHEIPRESASSWLGIATGDYGRFAAILFGICGVGSYHVRNKQLGVVTSIVNKKLSGSQP
jgi:hypothetical protein